MSTENHPQPDDSKINSRVEQAIREFLQTHNMRQFILTDEEKEQGRVYLKALIQATSPERGFSVWHSLFSKRVVALVLVSLFMVGGSVSAAASSTLPGDPLYPIKVNVNENIRTMLTFSTQGKAEWEVERAQRRLEESAELAVQHRLEQSESTELQTYLQSHVQEANYYANQLAQEGNVNAAASIQSNLEAVLGSHAAILTGLTQETETPVPSPSPTITANTKAVAGVTSTQTPEQVFAESIQKQAEEASKLRAQMEDRLDTEAEPNVQEAATQAQQVAQSRVDATDSFIAQQETVSGTNATAAAKTQLQAAQQMLQQGNTLYAQGQYAQAFRVFQSAIRTAQEARFLVQTSSSLRVDIDVDSYGNTYIHVQEPNSANSEVQQGSQQKHGESGEGFSRQPSASSTPNPSVGPSTSPSTQPSPMLRLKVNEDSFAPIGN